MADEEVIKRRLTFDGDGTGEDRRLNVITKMITKFINSPHEELKNEGKATCDKVLNLLATIENARIRSGLVHEQAKVQLDKYQTLHKDMERKISSINRDIGKQKLKLEQAKVIKMNRIKYDLMAKAIEEQPARTVMNSKLKQLREELPVLYDDKAELTEKLQNRKKQFRLMTSSCTSLKTFLDENQTVLPQEDGEVVEPMSD